MASIPVLGVQATLERHNIAKKNHNYIGWKLAAGIRESFCLYLLVSVFKFMVSDC